MKPVTILAAVIITLQCAEQASAGPDSFQDGVEAFNEKNYAKAIDHFTQAMEVFPNNLALYLWRARAHLGAENFDKANDDYAEAISLDPLDPDGYIGRGTILLGKRITKSLWSTIPRPSNVIPTTLGPTMEGAAPICG